MAVKKKETAAKSQSNTTSKQSKQQLKALAKVGSDSGKTKATKLPANPQKQRSAENEEVKERLSKLPFWQQILEVGVFLNEVRNEARKISWPERSQVIRETVSVLFLVALITFFVWSFDLVVGKFVFSPLEHLGHLYGIGGSS